MHMVEGDDCYAIVANIRKTDGSLRSGAKCWLVGGQNGDGAERFKWRGVSRGGRVITKWAPTKSFQNFRVAWVPDEMRRYFDHDRTMGERARVEPWTVMFNERHPPEHGPDKAHDGVPE
jgi:hypothetical protein